MERRRGRLKLYCFLSTIEPKNVEMKPLEYESWNRIYGYPKGGAGIETLYMPTLICGRIIWHGDEHER
ncbi:hypothetical protein Tco_0534514 [Tanacetum coccineum]